MLNESSKHSLSFRPSLRVEKSPMMSNDKSLDMQFKTRVGIWSFLLPKISKGLGNHE